MLLLVVGTIALVANLLLAPKLADSVAALHRRYAGLDQLAEYKRQLESPSDTMAGLQADTSPQADVSEAFELAQQRLATTQLEQKADGNEQAQNVNRDDVAMPPECEAMWMHDKYRKTFVDTLTRRKIKQYLEWGGGGSTLCSSRLVEQGTAPPHQLPRHRTHHACSHNDRAQQRVVQAPEGAAPGQERDQRQPHLLGRGMGTVW
jgi:hypothetical protein